MTEKERDKIYDEMIEAIEEKREKYITAKKACEVLPAGRGVMEFCEALENMDFGLSIALNELVCRRVQ